MQFVLTGSGDDGRSKIVETREILPGLTPTSGNQNDVLWSTAQFPPEIPAVARTPDEPLHDFGYRHQTTGWMFTWIAPDFKDHFHRTDTLDYVIVVSGEVTIVLEEGEALLRAGDAVMLPGVTHIWEPGPAGCVIVNTPLTLAPVEVHAPCPHEGCQVTVLKL